jgi:fucose permease
MAEQLPVISSTPQPTTSARYAPVLRLFVFGLFFVFGGIASLNDVIIPKLKGLFALGYSELMLVLDASLEAVDSGSLSSAALCYLGILLFGWTARRPHRALLASLANSAA